VLKVAAAAQLRVRDTRSRTPLDCAALHGNFECVKELASADATWKDDWYCYDTIKYAVKGGSVEVVKYLVGFFSYEKGREIIRTFSGGFAGETLLMVASFWGHVEVVRFILEYLGENESRDEIVQCGGRQGHRDMTAFEEAVSYGHLDVVKLFAGTMGDEYLKSACNSRGATLMMTASLRGHIAIVKFLLERLDKEEGKKAIITPTVEAMHHESAKILHRNSEN